MSEELIKNTEEGAEQPKLVRNKYADMMNKQRRKLPKLLKIGVLAVLIAGLSAEECGS